MRFSRSTHLLMFLSLRTLTSIIRTGLPILVELIDLVNFCNFSISNNLTQMVNFPRWIPDCDSHSPTRLNLFLSSDASICSTMVFRPLGNSDHVVVSVSIDFSSNSQRDALFHCITYDCSHADWDVFCDYLRDVPWQDIFKLSASAAASEFCEWVQVGSDLYISHRKYQVKTHSSPWFLASFAAAIANRNHFFHLYQKDRSSDSKLKFSQASNHCKRVLEAAKLAYASKTKETITSRNLALVTFGKLPIAFSTKVNLLYLLYSTPRRCCRLYLIKQNCLLKTFRRSLILMTQVSLHLFSLLELI